LEVSDANAEEARSREVLQELWRSTYEESRGRWGSRIPAALLTAEILLAGVHGGWVSWEVAGRCAASRREIQGQDAWPEAFVRLLRHYAEAGPSPYRREPFEQLARELGRPLPFLSHEAPPSQAELLNHGVRSAHEGPRLLREALSAMEEMGRPHPDCVGAAPLADGPRYRMLGNAVSVPVAEWIGRRLAPTESTGADTPADTRSESAARSTDREGDDA